MMLQWFWCYRRAHPCLLLNRKLFMNFIDLLGYVIHSGCIKDLTRVTNGRQRLEV